MKILDVRHDLAFDDNKIAAIQRSQTIPQWFMDQLKAERDASTATAADEMHKVASVPAIFIEKMMREGINFFCASHKDIRNWLLKNGLDHFITTNKRV